MTQRWPDTRSDTEPDGPTGALAAGQSQDASAPLVWVLQDDRPGNASQSQGLAQALGWPYVIKTLSPGIFSGLHNRLIGASLKGIDRTRSSPLAAPWPDLVIAAGRRTAPVALWIRRQSRGQAKLVMLGRKAGDAADRFDLVITPSYCRLSPHPARLETGAPLHSITAQRLADAAAQWRDWCADAPRPWIALIVGGTSGQYRIAAADAKKLGDDVMAMATRLGGSVFATSSRRLGDDATQALGEALNDARHFYRWHADDRRNPYLGFLALADQFVVTGDSETMLSEVTSLGKPVAIYPLPVKRAYRIKSALREWVVGQAMSGRSSASGASWLQKKIARLCAWLIDRGFVRPPRDMALLHQDLIRRKRAVCFGQPMHTPPRGAADDISQVLGRVQKLMGIDR